MFSEILSEEKIEPKKMAFERPNPKFLNFLNQYYGLNDYVPQNNNYVVFKDYFKEENMKKDNHDIYNNNYNSNNNYNGCTINILSKRKLEKINKGNNNEKNSYNNKSNEQSQKDKDFTTRIYKEYYNSNENKKEQNHEENDYKCNQKKRFGYNQYQSNYSEYGAFFRMNK